MICCCYLRKLVKILNICMTVECDMTLESWNSPLLDSGSLTHVTMEMRIHGDWLGTERIFQVSRINKGFHGYEQAINIFHGDQRLCKWLCRQEWRHSQVSHHLALDIRKWINRSVTREFRRQFSSWVFSCGVLTSGQQKLKKWPTRKSEPSQSQWKWRHS
jgi:hypothetical protein